MEEDKELMKEVVKMLVWQHKMVHHYTELQDISDDLEKIFVDPRLSGHAIKTDILSLHCRLDALLQEITP